ncbi:hypothetical protein KKF60_02945 [Patescibacteria group bacterium]|nr:hypothetical protein [Patescibacteria group bacterium]MBU4458827.1 hypothetical protein [Patescibacteria group bacterium]MCG2696228.1 hypothetical protein [Candidatus Portnoybacteria bacterium]
MTKWKILVPIVIIVLVIVIFGINEFNLINNGDNSAKIQDVSKEMLPIPATTGNVDDIIDAILTFSDNEEILMNEETADINLITADSQEINDFGQSYNENEF